MMWSCLISLAALVAVTAALPSDYYNDDYYPSYPDYKNRYAPVVGNRPSYGSPSSGGGGGGGGGVCRLPVKTGPCKGFFERYAFSGGDCQQFIYGGCQGNGNNFETLAECQQACGYGGRYGRNF